MAYFGDLLPVVRPTVWSGSAAAKMAQPPIRVTLAPAVHGGASPRLTMRGGAILLDMPVSGVAGDVCYRVEADLHDVPRLRRFVRRAQNDRLYAQVTGGLVLLLALCGWVIGGDEGVRWLIGEATRAPTGPPFSPEIMRQRFGARRIHPAEWPGLFAVLRDICERARLPRWPNLYVIPGERSMNAYALGGPEGSVVTLTEGLLRGMSLDEIAGIMAHEIAHICSNDARAMTLAGALQRAIAVASAQALTRLGGRPGPLPAQPLASVLGGAAAIGELLTLALSRLQEVDADALAAELIDPKMLAAALDKLERHHRGVRQSPAEVEQCGVGRLLRSHPATEERVGLLLGLAH